MNYALDIAEDEIYEIIAQSSNKSDAYLRLMDWIGQANTSTHEMVLVILDKYDTIKKEAPYRKTKLYNKLQEE